MDSQLPSDAVHLRVVRLMMVRDTFTFLEVPEHRRKDMPHLASSGGVFAVINAREQ